MPDWFSRGAAGQGLSLLSDCSQCAPALLGVMATSDAVATVAYYSIALALLWFLRKRPDVPFHWVYVLCAAFICLCGTKHLVDFVAIWVPAYWLQILIKAITAAASATTAIALWVFMPNLLKLPSNQQLRELIVRLEREVSDRNAAEARLDELNAQLERRVAERTHELQASLADTERLMEADRARSIAEAESRAKSDFLSSMSHELRTPLNAILGFGQLLDMQGKIGNLRSKHHQWVRHIQASGQHLLELIEDVLDMARIEAGALPIAKEPIDLHATVKECEAMLDTPAKEQGVQLVMQVLARRGVVTTDAKRLKQVLVNLVGNAIKYNRVGGRVDATIEADDEELRIFVSDTGVGMSQEQVEQLFQPFNRLGREGDTQRPGTGLGLVITKQVVEALGGSITVKSERGRGTQFVAVLPLT